LIHDIISKSFDNPFRVGLVISKLIGYPLLYDQIAIHSFSVYIQIIKNLSDDDRGNRRINSIPRVAVNKINYKIRNSEYEEDDRRRLIDDGDGSSGRGGHRYTRVHIRERYCLISVII
jgi:hypothetical protein